MSNWLKNHSLVSILFAGLLLATPSAIVNHDLLIRVALAAEKKVSELTALTGANSATADLFMIVDTDATQSKSITRDELAIGLGGPMGIVVESTPGTACTATGTDAVCIGDNAEAGDASGDEGVLAIGAGALATGINSIAIGQFADATANNAVAIGGNSTDNNSADATADSALAIGSFTAASGLGSIAIGVFAQATASQSFAFGQNTDASGVGCIALGGNGTDTDSADCSAVDSVALGQHILADDIGEFAFASGEFATQSDAHTSIFVLRNNTTDATQTELFSDGSAGQVSIASDCTATFNVLITARQTDADDFSAGYSFQGVIDNNAGTTALGTLGSVTVIHEDEVDWDVTATADDTNDGLNVLVTGKASDAVQWVARVEVVETCG